MYMYVKIHSIMAYIPYAGSIYCLYNSYANHKIFPFPVEALLPDHYSHGKTIIIL